MPHPPFDRITSLLPWDCEQSPVTGSLVPEVLKSRFRPIRSTRPIPYILATPR